ncbi:DUF1798 family protein [Bacillus massiliigorillae]|uniref:DUF1798 family protein n=1 Tax=Bacillus massiliigorillae TaxID=1243664 RepID=UPI0003A064E0|nr:DUF1798 family protein [Bacillus massiliigorillae]
MTREEALLYTKELNKLLDDINEKYEKVRLTKEEADFYKDVEPYANSVRDRAQKWYESIQQVIENNEAYIQGERQVEQVVDNICTLSVQAFQYSTSYSRFKSYYQSTKFLLKTIERQLV